MFYFIPAWYNPWRSWYDTTEPWYRGGGYQGFDDTINQLRMFEYAGHDNQLTVLNYMPQLRYLTHQYDLFEVATWSLFDDIQNIKSPRQHRIDFKQLDWPQGSEFIYTPFLVLVRHQKKRLATVDFGNDGQLIWINYYQSDEVLSHRYLFDDRGFVSSIIYFQNGQEHHQDYLNPAGQWQVREYLLPEDKHVEVSAAAANRFNQSRYDSMADLVKEKVTAYFADKDQKEDCLIVASHHLHNDLLLGVKGQKKLILSYYQNRFDLSQKDQVRQHLLASDLVVADNLGLTEELQSFDLATIEHLSPFDTRLSLGKSQRLKELEVYFLMDGLEESQLKEYLSDIFVAMDQNDHINLVLVTADHNGGAREAKEKFIEDLLAQEEKDYLYLEKEEKTTMFEIVDEEELAPTRVSFNYLGNELAVQKALEFARLIVDLREQPDLYTQIAGISAGIPQVNKKESEFVEHLKNGYIVKDDADLFIALDYYLTGLSNWNRSLVYAVQKIEDYTSGRLVRRLLEKL